MLVEIFRFHLGYEYSANCCGRKCGRSSVSFGDAFFGHCVFTGASIRESYVLDDQQKRENLVPDLSRQTEEARVRLNLATRSQGSVKADIDCTTR